MWRSLSLLVALAAAPAPVWAETTAPASLFTDSVGVNVHVGYTNTAYWSGFATWKQLLVDLGVKHLRDGAQNDRGNFAAWDRADRFAELGRAGLRVNFIVNPGVTTTFIDGFPARVAPAFESWENQNEPNLAGDPNWAAKLRAFMPLLYKTVKSNPATASYPVLGSAMAVVGGSPNATLGDVSAWVDYGNTHPYFAGRNPGTPGWGSAGAAPCAATRYGSLAFNNCQAKISYPGRDLIWTETGYGDNVALLCQVPSAVKSRYTLRTLLEAFNNSVQRTYFYELIDIDNGKWGLLDNSLKPKPVYTALRSLLSLVRDTGSSGAGININWSLSGATADVHHTLLHKSDGTVLLALWIEKSSFDVAPAKLTPVAPQAVGVRLPASVSTIAINRIDDSGTTTTTSLIGAIDGMGNRTFNLQVTDNVTVLAFPKP